MDNRQSEIAKTLNVVPRFDSEALLAAEVERRKEFIKDTLRQTGLKVLVLGISGGVDSTTAGRLAQLSVEELRRDTGDAGYRFIAVRLPYGAQHDETDAGAALEFIRADENVTVNIAPAVQALDAGLDALSGASTVGEKHRDFVRGNTKARMRMIVQYAIANEKAGLVVGTDHAAEAVMGFFTKFGDGACDLAPLEGLVKSQVRNIARYLGASEKLYLKTPTADLEELTPGRPDEDAHGVTYQEIDAFLQGEAVASHAYETIARAYDATAHKRRLPYTPQDPS